MTREAAQRDMQRVLSPGSTAYLYQYPHGGWDWASEDSYRGLECSKALEASKTTACFRSSTGASLCVIHHIERTRA